MAYFKKVAIVTGASQGLGQGIVQGFRARGYGVVATSRGIQPSTDPDLVTVAGDIGDPETGKRLVAAALDTFGRIRRSDRRPLELLRLALARDISSMSLFWRAFSRDYVTPPDRDRL